jgi:hypothetical protein
VLFSRTGATKNDNMAHADARAAHRLRHRFPTASRQIVMPNARSDQGSKTSDAARGDDDLIDIFVG